MAIPTGLSEGAAVDDATQTVVDLPRLHEDTTFNDLLTADGDDEDLLGTPFDVIRRSDVEFHTPEMAGASQLQTWADDDTPIEMVAVGPAQVLQWYNATRLSTNPSEEAAAGPTETARLHLRRTDSPDGHGVYWSRNALFYNNWNEEGGFVDSNSDGVPDGYTYASGSLSGEAVSGGVYEAFGPTDGSTAERGDEVLMPLPRAQTWTLSVEVTQLHGDGQTFIALEAVDAGGSVVASQETEATSTGRITAEITAPDATYELRAIVLRVKNASAQNQKAKVTEPALRVDGGTSYVTR